MTSELLRLTQGKVAFKAITGANNTWLYCITQAKNCLVSTTYAQGHGNTKAVKIRSKRHGLHQKQALIQNLEYIA